MPDALAREVVGLFPDPRTMEAAVQELLSSGFDHGDLSLLATEGVVREQLGHRLDDSVAAADDPDSPRRGWVAPETRTEGRGALGSALGYLGAVTALGLVFATGGGAAVAVGAALLGAGAGAGAGFGLGRLFDRRLADEFERQLETGGILIWVRCRDTAAEARAVSVLTGHGAHHVHPFEAPPAT
ncbi:hypothetical protein [Magnetospirillum sp. UT-4]|uniref:hypothetical protein n=1 Tax=Magnetospirillum sp. UT-4 TaxID=2681467 RepID=UPI0013863D3B|nr:hypothetical protein [Magnetospirillum sp. UT-4]CAA7624542.1 conserved hypothetical protein [Magnetospirillum sp. UT-4]